MAIVFFVSSCEPATVRLFSFGPALHAAARRLALLATMVLSLGAVGSMAQPATNPHDALVDVLVWGVHQRIDVNAYAPDVKRELDKLLQRSQAYRSRRPRPVNSPEEQILHDARVGYERRLVAVSGGARAEALAVEYVDRLRPCYEWEGFHDCPEHEARFARDYLEANPDGPFKEYLPLLAAHRWLCTAEAYDYEKRPRDAARTRRAYANAISVARRSTSLLVRTAAEALQARGRCRS